MQESSELHTCSTCIHSMQPQWSTIPGAPAEPRLEVPALSLSAIMHGHVAIFPLEHALDCSLCRDAISESCVQAVLVRCDGWCESYECHEERFRQAHGFTPDHTGYGADEGNCARYTTTSYKM